MKQTTILKKAIEKIEWGVERMNDGGRHWIQGKFTKRLPNGELGYCMLGSINYPKASNPDSPIYRAAAAMRSEVEAAGYRHVPDFNDHPSTKWRDVKMMMNRAKKRLEEDLKEQEKWEKDHA